MKRILMISLFVVSACSVRGESAEQAWSKLVGAKTVKSAAYVYVENNKQLPNVFIYGDSISVGYTAYVRKFLEGKANVYRLYSNGSDSSKVLPKMEEMHRVMRNKELEGYWDFEWDVIHFNVGLHDLKYFKGGKLDISGQQIASPEEYVNNLEKIIKYFKKIAPTARLIFATTTPVPANSNGRKEGDAKRYNEAAMKLLKSFPEIAISDLYALTLPNQREWWIKPGNVHFTPAGCEAQGREVAHAISRALK